MMKPGEIILGAIALFFVVDLLVGDENGVLSRLQENSRQAATTDLEPKPVATPAARTASAAATSSSPWSVGEDSPPVEVGEFAELEVSANEDPAGEQIPIEPQANSQPHAGSPEFPYVPLPKPQLTAAGAQVSYPPSGER